MSSTSNAGDVPVEADDAAHMPTGRVGLDDGRLSLGHVKHHPAADDQPDMPGSLAHQDYVYGPGFIDLGPCIGIHKIAEFDACEPAISDPHQPIAVAAVFPSPTCFPR